jgi:hypothetical protein
MGFQSKIFLVTLERSDSVCVYTKVDPCEEEPAVAGYRSSADKSWPEPEAFPVIQSYPGITI